MRQQGILTEWNDARGFGFITPSDGGARIFVHVSAFPRGRRPVANDAVTYGMGLDARNRNRAFDVLYAVPARDMRTRTHGLPAAFATATLFFTVLAGLAAVKQVPALLLAGYGVLSLVAFAMYRADKAAAERGTWRVREAHLHVIDLVGGWPGGLVARRALRHKTRKQPFRTIFWGTVAANCLALAWLVYDMPSGLS